MKKFLLIPFLWLIANIAYANTLNDVEAQISAVLTQYHQAASKADSNSYFKLFTEDAILLGTDAGERWTKQDFRAYVEPYFSQGRGWSYLSTQRNITVNKQHTMAFFDELLLNENYGQCRGSGVIIKTGDGWKIAQYNLAVTVPNAIAKSVVQQIKDHLEVRK